MKTDPNSKSKITVLLIDDQAMIGEAVRRMLLTESDIIYHYCSDPLQALARTQQVQPTVILQDLVMPQMDGMTLAKQFRSSPDTHEIPLIVLSTKEDPKIKADAFGIGANDYLVKLPDKIELIARIRHHSQGYINLLERNAAYQALEASQAALAKELHEAAIYVRSILPKPLRGPITTNWRFISSSSLGGDAFGYHWIDENHFAIYLLDVCGHGVGAALLSISAMNVLRAQTLAATDFRDPSQVLKGLNEAFQMETQNDMYFTIWYGVLNKNTRKLNYASGGHPPAVLLPCQASMLAEVAEPAQPILLRTPNLSIGSLSGIEFQTAQTSIPDGSKLYVFSDGTYELNKKDGGMLELHEFVQLLSTPTPDGDADMERVITFAREVSGQPTFDDDFSIVRLDFS